jgi:hypothetical protein
MKLKEIKITTLFFFVALALLFLILWLVDYSGFGIPELIPQVNLRTYGIMIMLAFLLVQFLVQKILLNSDPGISVLKLTLLSTGVTFFSLLVYQVIRQNVILHRPFSTAEIFSFTVPTLVFALMALSTALSLKKARLIYRQIPFVILLILVLLSRQYVHSFEW